MELLILKIDSIDVRVRDLFTNGLFLVTSSQKIQLNEGILKQLADNLRILQVLSSQILRGLQIYVLKKTIKLIVHLIQERIK